MEDYRKVIQALQTLFPAWQGDLELKENDLSAFPFWLRSAASVHTLRLPGGNERLTLIHPKTGLSFDQLMNVYRQVEQKTGAHTLLVADDINPKHRPLLVRSGIQFVYRDETIFAPNLALMFRKLRPYKQKDTTKGESLQHQVPPLALKLLSAYLTNQLPKTVSLQTLQRQLNQQKVKVSLAKLSLVMSELVHFGIVKTSGNGPKKLFVFLEPNEAWTTLGNARISPIMKPMQLPQFKTTGVEHVLAGESALAEYSDLASPKNPTIAVTTKTYRKLLERVSTKELQRETYVQVWKEAPELFAIKGNLNPIELYISMRDHGDERIQLALKSMLKKYGLSPWKE